MRGRITFELGRLERLVLPARLAPLDRPVPLGQPAPPVLPALPGLLASPALPGLPVSLERLGQLAPLDRPVLLALLAPAEKPEPLPHCLWAMSPPVILVHRLS